MGGHSTDGPVAASTRSYPNLRSRTNNPPVSSPPSSPGTSIEPASGDELANTTEPPSSPSSDEAPFSKASVSPSTSRKGEREPSFLPVPPSPVPSPVTPIDSPPPRGTAVASPALQHRPRSRSQGPPSQRLPSSRPSRPEPGPPRERQSSINDLLPSSSTAGRSLSPSRPFSSSGDPAHGPLPLSSPDGPVASSAEHLGDSWIPTERRRRRIPASRAPRAAPRDPNAVTVLARPDSSRDGSKQLSRLPLTKLCNVLKQFGPFLATRPIKDGGLAIDYKAGTDVSQLLDTVSLLDVPVKVSWPAVTSHRSGRVEGVPPGDSMEDLKQAFNEASRDSYLVTRVQRLSRDDSRPGPCKIVFEGSELPSEVRLFNLVYPVSLFIPRALQCRNCQRWNHHEAACQSQARCRFCGRAHPSDKCTAHTAVRCSNCRGGHRADSRDCPFFAHEKEVSRIKAQLDVSFPEARRTYAQAAAARLKPPIPASGNPAVLEETVPQRNAKSGKANAASLSEAPTTAVSKKVSRKKKRQRRKPNGGPRPSPLGTQAIEPGSVTQAEPEAQPVTQTQPVCLALPVTQAPAHAQSSLCPVPPVELASTDSWKSLLGDLLAIVARFNQLSKREPTLDQLVGSSLGPVLKSLLGPSAAPALAQCNCQCKSSPPNSSPNGQ